MLPIPELRLSNVPVIISEALFTLLLIAFWWKKDRRTFYFHKHPDHYTIFFSIIMGIVTNATMLGSITQPEEPYYRGLFISSFIFYNTLTSTVWLLGTQEILRVMNHRKAAFEEITRNFTTASFFLTLTIFGFSVAVEALYVEIIDPDFDGDYETKFTIYTNLSTAVVFLRWLFLIFYCVPVYKSYRLLDRKNIDILVAFGFLNFIPALADSIYIITKFTFPNPIGVSFIMFFMTDFMLVANIAMVMLSWKVETYTRLLPVANPNTNATTTTTTQSTHNQLQAQYLVYFYSGIVIGTLSNRSIKVNHSNLKGLIVLYLLLDIE
ncbi:hypothetical protein K501DRAFT_276555 [Backusella circina FSU 941]|nr:hypothetical protein K501DRAFT_276555 [Backusella circina FSU 941]